MEVTYRPAGAEDNPAAYRVFRDSLEALLVQLAVMSEPKTEEARQQLWEEKYASIFEHLAATAESFWLAEADGEAIGFARTINRGGLRELTELFVSPEAQAAGVGRELLARAFPAEGAERRTIVATLDPRAQARYLRCGVYPRMPVMALARSPEPLPAPDGLEAVPAAELPDAIKVMGRIDDVLLGHRRDPDLRWLMEERRGFIYRRDAEPVGYGFVAELPGPIAVLDEQDLPAVLSHMETQAAEMGIENLSFDVPGVNRAAIAHLLERGFRVDSWVVLLMSDEPFGSFERYVISSPTFFL